MHVATQPPVARVVTRPRISAPTWNAAALYLWLWTLPAIVLLALNSQAYWVVEGDMTSEQHGLAARLGLGGVINLAVSFLAYAVRRRAVPGAGAVARWLPPVLAVAANTAYLWLSVATAESAIPASARTWIYPPERLLFNQFSFAMLPLFLGLVQVACSIPVNRRSVAIGSSIAVAVGAPVVLFLGGSFVAHVLMPGAVPVVLMAAIMVGLSLAMFIGLIRGLLLALQAAWEWRPEVQHVATVAVALVLPLCGLLLNRHIPFPVDFQAWEVYALTLVNAAILLFASLQHELRPRLSFNLLCGTLPFSLYFFIVLLPYTPLAIVAIIVAGAGFLILTPTLLFVLHGQLLYQAHRAALADGGRMSRVIACGVASFLVLPTFFVVRATGDRDALKQALDHVYAPTISAGDMPFRGDVGSVRRALRGHRDYKDGIYYPLLSDFYSWVVFDNLVLPDAKLAALEEVFHGASQAESDEGRASRNPFGGRTVRDRHRMPRAAAVPRTVVVEAVHENVQPAAGGSAVYTSLLRLRNTGAQQAEYVTTLPMGPGVFVNGFRLHINGVPVPGRIFEKKTALWVYTMIRDTERRDPGLLTYAGPNQLSLRVYPIAAGATATVEIDYLLPQPPEPGGAPLAAKDPAAVSAWVGRQVMPRMVSTPGGVYLAGEPLAGTLPGTEREAYLHIIVDRSEPNGFEGDLAATIQALRGHFPTARRGRISFAHHDVIDVRPELTPLEELAGNLPRDLDAVLPRSGGLALDLALAHALRLHRDADLDQVTGTTAPPPRPVFVILGRAAVLRKGDLDVAEAWADLAGGLEVHEHGSDGSRVVQRNDAATHLPLLRSGASVRPLRPGAAPRFTGEPGNALEYWDPTNRSWTAVATTPAVESPGTPWAAAAELHGRNQDHRLDPGGSGIALKTLVDASREQGVLIPATAYIVVENSAQWRALEMGERQKLSQNAALEFKETPAPPGLWLAAGFLVTVGLRRWVRRCRNVADR